MTDTRTRNAQQHDEQIEHIRRNRDLTDDAKRRMIRGVLMNVLEEHARLTQEGRGAA